MARPARYSDDDILDGAALAVSQRGRDATMTDVARAIGGPTGSIYHRFRSREELFARLWIRSIERFHVGFLAAVTIESPDRAIRLSAAHIPVFCRSHPLEANAMTLFRQRDLATTGPENLRFAAAHINDDIDAATTSLAERRYPEATPQRLEVLTTATRLAPYGLVRPRIGSAIPTWIDDAAAATATAIAALGD